MGLTVTGCFAVAATAVGDAGVEDTGRGSLDARDSAGKDAGVVPDVVFTVPYGAPAWDSGAREAGSGADAATDAADDANGADGDAGHPTAVPGYVRPPSGHWRALRRPLP
jgi:hypothetical protein